jgi:hypothetical protein
MKEMEEECTRKEGGDKCFKEVEQWFPKWAVLPPGGVLEVGPSKHVVRLFMIEVTSDQTLGKWYHFIKPSIALRIY